MQPKSKTTGYVLTAFAVVAGVLMLGLLALGLLADQPTSEEQAVDRQALGVCIQFYEVAEDVQAGTISDMQIVPRMQAVWEEARYIDNLTIRNGIRDALAGANSGTGSVAAAQQVDRECNRLTEKYGN